MFTTFAGASQPAANTKPETVTEAPEMRTFEAPLRPKRQQVSRACDSCRLHRIKCDNNVPCRNCLNRGEHCINKSPSERRTLPQAYREIDRLNQRVRELEAQLERENAPCKHTMPEAPPPAILTPPSSGDPLVVTARETSVPKRSATSRVWNGVYTSTAQSPAKTWYGPSSVFYFISRMNNYLASVFQMMGPDDHIQLKSVAKTFATPDCAQDEDEGKLEAKEAGQQAATSEYLTPTQEDYFLSLFWQSYHTTLIVLNEAEFKEHYRSLLSKPGNPRKPSALVDIVIAVSMQIGMAMIQRNSSKTPTASEVGKDDPSIAGRLYYRRAQRLIKNEQESPTIATVQCHILSAAYLCCASFQNISHAALSLAVRTAHMLGLHVEPADDLPVATREMHKRLWWTLYTFESKTCMKLGRPFYAELSSTSCSLPADDHSVANTAGSEFVALDEKTNWLTFTLHNTNLLLTARAVHTALYDKYPEYYSGEKGTVIYDDPAALEAYANFLVTPLKRFEDWVKSVPPALQAKRKDNGAPLSTDRSPVIIEQLAPLWLQRQRLLLELLYHNLIMNTYRPFLSFPSQSNTTSTPTPMTLEHATSAAEHGMALTRVMHQSLSESDILLAGLHEAFQWQWNAGLTLAGYLFAHPNTPTSAAVRQTIDLAVIVFEMFGLGFGAGNHAANVMRDLAAKIDLLAEFRRQTESQVSSISNAPVDAVDTASLANDYQTLPVPFTNEMPPLQGMPINGAFSVDTSGDLEMLWPSMGTMPDQWWYDFSQAPAVDINDETFA
ncbi:hypothetical protein F5Y15DRAFT_322895 [Xylariaceae sp. FL0016]|nr:hypothetical protein F5Y15DRAFT_322895 [Xylariaceae sp. FL0016]